MAICDGDPRHVTSRHAIMKGREWNVRKGLLCGHVASVNQNIPETANKLVATASSPRAQPQQPAQGSCRSSIYNYMT